MIAFLLTIYTAIVIVLFKLKVLKPRPYPIAGVIVAGVLIIGSVVIAWAFCAPLSSRLVTTQYVVQLVPYVKGQVAKVHAQANQPVKKGDLLLEINPAPYQYKVNELQAQLEATEEGVKQAQAGLEAAQANVVKAKAGVNQALAAINQARAAVANSQAGLSKAKAAVADAMAALAKAKAADELARTEEQIATNLQQTDAGAISALRVTQAQQNRKASEAALNQADTGVSQAQAAEQQAEAAVRQAEFGVKVAQSKVPGVQAQLDNARFDLAQCRMTAPADGYVVNWVVQEGTMLVPMPLAAAGTFISTSETLIVASFPQNYLANVQPGDKVELILDPYPGRLYQGIRPIFGSIPVSIWSAVLFAN